ncbi:MAG: peptide ABC transporter substrate-binding protein, partial [Ktedonobacterales bacterium]
MLKQRKLWSLIAGLGMLAILVLSACGPSASSANTGPKSGGSIIDGLFEEPDSLLPEQSIETFADLVDATIWAPLLYGDNTGIIQAGLAKEVPSATNGGISADAKTYTIHLRSGLKWSDGSPLTSDDVMFSLNLFRNPAYGGKTQTSEFAKIDTVTAPDPQTVVITLKTTDVAFMALALTDPLNFAPVPKSVFGSMDPATVAKSPQNFQPTVDSGPFTISDRAKSDHITVVRNKYYYQAPKPYLDKITFKIVTDSTTMLSGLQSGAITNSWFLSITNLAQYKAIAGYNVVYDKTPGTYEGIYFNFKNPTLNDLKVRQAITMGIDTSVLIRDVWKGIASPTCDDATGTFAHEPSLIPCYKYDPTAAKALLTSDGYTFDAGSGYFTKGGKTLELRYSTTANNAYRAQSEQIVQDQLKKIGIKIDIVNSPADTFFGTVLYNYSSYDIAEFANSLGYDPDNHTQWACTQFTDKGGFNISAYCNPEVDAAINIELTNPDITARKAAFHTIHTDIIKDLPAMWYYTFPD